MGDFGPLPPVQGKRVMTGLHLPDPSCQNAARPTSADHRRLRVLFQGLLPLFRTLPYFYVLI